MGRHLAKQLKVLTLPDLHIPHEIDLTGIKAFMKDWQPDHLILLGDFMNCDPVSHWVLDKKRVVEGMRLKEEYAHANRVISEFVQLCPKSRITYFIGNHENWVEQYLDRHPEMEGLIEVESHLKNIDQFIPFNETFRIGKLNFMHGIYTNDFHAKKTSLSYMCNMIYGHVHDVQEYSVITPIDQKAHTAKSIGCLCKGEELSYLQNKPTRWVHGFNIAYIREDGTFNDYTIHITNGTFTVEGITY